MAMGFGAAVVDRCHRRAQTGVTGGGQGPLGAGTPAAGPSRDRAASQTAVPALGPAGLQSAQPGCYSQGLNTPDTVLGGGGRDRGRNACSPVALM